MHLVYTFFALASVCSVVLASPAATKSSSSSKITASITTTKSSTSATSTASSKTKTTKPCTLLTYTAKFDTLPTGTSPPDNYQAADWSGFTVVNAVSTAFTRAKSGAKVAQAPAEGAYLAIGSADDGIIMELTSFWLSCSAQLPGEDQEVPVGCDVQVVSEADTPLLDIQSYGPFSYQAGEISEGNPANMTKFEVGGEGSIFWFYVTSGASFTQIYLDNVVMVQQNPACLGDD